MTVEVDHALVLRLATRGSGSAICPSRVSSAICWMQSAEEPGLVGAILDSEKTSAELGDVRRYAPRLVATSIKRDRTWHPTLGKSQRHPPVRIVVHSS